MDEKELRQRLHHAADARLSGLEPDPWLAERVLANAKGGQKVKKKISAGFVLAVVLILAAMTALAVGLTSYFKGFASLENSYGEYESWPDGAKVELVQLMKENGMLSEEDDSQWTQEMTQSEKESMAEHILTERFENLHCVDIFNIMQNELGLIDNWNLEDKALYSSLLIENGEQKDDSPVYLMPEKEDIQQEEAILRAKQILDEKFFAKERIEKCDVNAEFFEEVVGEEPIWFIEFSNPDLFSGMYRVTMTRKGEIISYDSPQSPAYFVGDDEDILEKAEFVIPGEFDKSYEEIMEIAKSSIREIGDFENRMEQLEIKPYFLYHERFNFGYEPVWLIYFEENGKQVYKMLFTYDGEYMDSAPFDAEFDNTILNRNEMDLGVEFSINFEFYSIEEKAEFTKEWKPIVDEYVKTHPYYENYNYLLYRATRRIYGIPGEKDLSQEEAARIAKEQIIAAGASEETIEDRRISYTFDVTEPEKPIWKIKLCPVSYDKWKKNSCDTDVYTYQAIINGRTGEMIAVYNSQEDNEILWENL